MKVLGLNFGRAKGGVGRAFLEQAIAGAQEMGAETQIIDMVNLTIGRCIGCGKCSSSSRNDGAPCVECVIKDDFQMVRDAIYESDGIIAYCPVYCISPVGQYKNLVDRLGPANDFGQTMKEHMKRRSLTADPKNPGMLAPHDQVDMVPFDKRNFKHRSIGYISLGGAKDHHWVSLGIPLMKTLGFPIGATFVDYCDFHGMGKIFGEPGYKEKMYDRAKELGKNVAEFANKHPLQIQYRGDPGICPMCHSKMVQFRNGTTVDCPDCGIEGKISIENGEIVVNYPVENWDYSRYTMGGLVEHCSFGMMQPAPY